MPAGGRAIPSPDLELLKLELTGARALNWMMSGV